MELHPENLIYFYLTGSLLAVAFSILAFILYKDRENEIQWKIEKHRRKYSQTKKFADS